MSLNWRGNAAFRGLWLGLCVRNLGEECPFRLPVSAGSFWCLVFDGALHPVDATSVAVLKPARRERPPNRRTADIAACNLDQWLCCSGPSAVIIVHLIDGQAVATLQF